MFAHPAFGDQLLKHFPPRRHAAIAVGEIRLLRPVAKFGPLLNKQFDMVRMVAEECQIRPNRVGHALQRIGVGRNAGIDKLARALHPAIRRREKQLFLAGEIAIDRPLGDIEGRGDVFHVGVAVSMLGK